MHKTRVLVVDDEQGMLEVCRDTLATFEEMDVVTEQDSERAAERLRTNTWDLVVLDIRMPGLSGMELLEIARQKDPDQLVLVLTAYPTVETAVESMKLGAADYITKPFLPDDLRATVHRLLDSRRLDEENRLLRRHLERSYAFGDMVGRSAAMLDVFDAIKRAGESNVDVLILGETGTGKELVARSVHQHSPRRTGHFVPVDCGAIPEDLLESEFFGHERGAFSGAESRRLGLLEFAAGGTLFLDEVDHLPPKLQAKLLRALQERRIRRVGGTEEFDVDIRVVAASSTDLDQLVRTDRFRADLYYRINVVRISLPPLRGRPEDIPVLATHFATRFASEMGHEQVELDPEALEVLTAYAWPGNVRELQNVIRRILAMERPDIIRLNDLPDEIITGAGDTTTPDVRGFFALRDQQVIAFEQRYFHDLLRVHGGDVSAAATAAGVPRGTLYRLLKKHGLDPNDYRD